MKNSFFKILIKYFFVALFATIIDIMLLLFLTEFLNLFYFFSSAISYIIGGLIHFYLNKKYTFKNKNIKYSLQLSIFFTISLIGLFINQVIIYFFVEYFNFWYIFAKLISVVIVFFFNFFGHKIITFGLLK
jgi:putative flippase GtrA